MNIKSLGDLLRTTEQELLSYKNFGETSLNEIKALLAQKGLRLGQAAEDGKARGRRTPRPAAGRRGQRRARRSWASRSPTWSCPSAAARRCSG